MAHFAKVNDGIVEQVIVAELDFFKAFVDSSPGEWIHGTLDKVAFIDIRLGCVLVDGYEIKRLSVFGKGRLIVVTRTPGHVCWCSKFISLF